MTKSRSRLTLLLLAAVVIATALSPLWAAPADTPLAVYTKKVYPNGLTLIVKEIEGAPIAAVDIWVGVGARDETAAESGIAHFFEHMLFKGTAQRKPGEIARAVESVGGYLNAATSLDTTHYYVAVPSEHWELALEVEADAIMNSSFDPAEIERERQVILEEISLKEDNPRRKLGWLAYQEAFAGTPYAKDVTGTAESLGQLKREQFLEFHRRFYRPNNMVVSVAGAVDAAKVEERVGELFKEFQPAPLPKTTRFKIPRLKAVKRLEQPMAVGQRYLYFGFPGPGASSRDLPALETLGVILGDGRLSRLHRELREERQLVNEVGAGYQSYQEIGMLAVYAQTQTGDPEQIREAVETALARLRRDGPAPEELAWAKARIQSYLAFASESATDIAGILGQAELLGDAGDVTRELAAIERLTPSDLRRAARKYLNPGGYVLAVVQPEVAKQ
jgi:zinc protease